MTGVRPPAGGSEGFDELATAAALVRRSRRLELGARVLTQVGAVVVATAIAESSDRDDALVLGLAAGTLALVSLSALAAVGHLSRAAHATRYLALLANAERGHLVLRGKDRTRTRPGQFLDRLLVLVAGVALVGWVSGTPVGRTVAFLAAVTCFILAALAVVAQEGGGTGLLERSAIDQLETDSEGLTWFATDGTRQRSRWDELTGVLVVWSAFSGRRTSIRGPSGWRRSPAEMLLEPRLEEPVDLAQVVEAARPREYARRRRFGAASSTVTLTRQGYPFD